PGCLFGGYAELLDETAFDGCGLAPERFDERLHVLGAQRHLVAGAQVTEPVERADVAAQALVLATPEVGDAVAEADLLGSSRSGVERDWTRRRRGGRDELRGVHTTGAGQAPEVAVGDRDLPALVRDELTPREAGRPRDLGQGEASAAADRTQMTAERGGVRGG